ncbi:MAG: lipid II flippase MurJ [Thermodesulfobacteriota bacterium]|nr:lipid II flippase MurJ [Thermodesulfobacteriota bacterium]
MNFYIGKDAEEEGGKKGSIIKTTLKVTIVKFVGGLLGLIAIILIAHRFGAGPQTDALFVGRIIPLMLATQFGRALSVAIVPIFTEARMTEGSEACGTVTGQFLLPLGLFLGLFVIAYYFLSPFIMQFIGSGLDAETLKLCNRITRILSVLILFLGSFSLLEAFLNVHGVFLIPEMAAGFLPIGTIIGVLVLADFFGIAGVPIGTVSGGALMLLIIWFFVRRRFNIRVLRPFDDLYSFLKRAFVQIVPVLWGSSASQISVAVGRSLAAFLGPGKVSVLSFGHRVCGSFPFVWGLAIGKVLLPYLSEQAVTRERDDIHASVMAFIRLMLLLFIPYSAALITLSMPITVLVFGHGAFADADVCYTASVISCYAPAVTFGAVNVIAMRTFFSLKKASIIFKTSTAFLVVCVGLSFILMPVMGVNGLASAYSLGLFFQMVLTLFFLGKEIGESIWRKVSIFALKALIAAGVASGAVYAFLCFFQFPYGIKTAAFLFVPGISMIIVVYLSTLWLLRVSEIFMLINVLGSTACRFVGASWKLKKP